MNLNEIAAQCDTAIETNDEDDIYRLVDCLKKYLETEDTSDNNRDVVHYLLGNLYSGLAVITAEDSAGWRTDNYPENLAHAINHFRQAEEFSSQSNSSHLGEIKTNLANGLAHQRRNIEALESWSCNFSIEGDAPYVSTLSKARELLWISYWLNDPGHAWCFRYEAYILLKSLQSVLDSIDHPGVINTITHDQEIGKLIKFGDDNFQKLQNWSSKQTCEDYSEDEKLYRLWCLKHRLFVNPLNDITHNWIADQDILQFPDHTVSLSVGPYYNAAFSSLKREFCFARFLAYEGINRIHPEYENKKLFLTDTLDYVHYSGFTEKIKTAFRVCFSVLDSLAALMNEYFGCNSKSVYFTSRWIKENLKGQDNCFIDALYWLACDLTDISKIPQENWKAPSPAVAEIRKMRIAIEHGWLRVAVQESSIWDNKNDFAYVVSPQTLEQNTLSVLKLVRSAILYFCLAVSYNEKHKATTDGLCVKLPITLVQDDFVKFDHYFP